MHMPLLQQNSGPGTSGLSLLGAAPADATEGEDGDAGGFIVALQNLLQQAGDEALSQAGEEAQPMEDIASPDFGEVVDLPMELPALSAEVTGQLNSLINRIGALLEEGDSSASGILEQLVEQIAGGLPQFSDRPVVEGDIEELATQLSIVMQSFSEGMRQYEVADPTARTLEAPAVEQLSDAAESVRELLAALLPRLESALQRWTNSGNSLPPAAAEGEVPVELSGETGQRNWQDIARMLLGANTETGTTAAQSVPELRPQAEVVANSVLNVKATAENSAKPMENVELMLADKNAAANLPEQDKLVQALAQLQDSLAARQNPSASSPLAPVSSALAGQSTGTSAPMQSLSLPTINLPPGDAAWSRALGERVMWMVGREAQSAEIRLNPPQLGPVEIRVSVQNDQANVSFTASHPFTREALEAAIPRLREMLGESNLNLVNVDVGQRDAGESRQQGSDGNLGPEPFAGDFADDVEMTDEQVVRTLISGGAGLVDDFA